LAVALSAPTYISDITIDHVAKEVAFDMRSAPREMEVWGMVEGKDNIAKVKAWQAEKAARNEEAKRVAKEKGIPFTDEVDVVYPKTLPKSPQYIRIANFTYNIHAPRNIQTFPVDEEIRELGVDFGIVVLRMKSNWGRDEYTCLYRLRVHGQRMGETPLPYPEEYA
jgi:SUN domain-containing protein 1/2